MAKLRHIAMLVDDIEKSATFYEKTFGMKRVRQHESAIAMSDGVVSLVFIHPSNQNMKGETIRGLHHIGFLIDDMQDVAQKVEANGAKFVGGILGTGSGLETERKYVDPSGVNFDITMPEYAKEFWKVKVDEAQDDTTDAMSSTTFVSDVHEVADAIEANELYQRNGWTDGLPIVPPTEESVTRFLAAAKLGAADVIGVEPVRRRSITAEKLAIAAVMAGCLPEYLPVIVAVVKAMCHPAYALHGSTASTGGSAPFIVVNGPIRLTLGMNATHNVFANASRANATIGRSVRLMLINILGGIPGQLDRSTLGHPGKFTFCIAEDEEDSPWLPLSVERGAPAGVSAVTVLQVESPHQIMNEWTHDPKEILDTYAAAMRSNLLTYSIWEGNYAMVIAKQHREIFAAAGWSKQNIREYVFEVARVKRSEWRDVGKAAVAGRKDEDKVYRALRSPDDLLVIAAGGPAGGFGAVLPPWYGNKSLAVTVPIAA